jgi:hypothetical protein
MKKKKISRRDMLSSTGKILFLSTGFLVTSKESQAANCYTIGSVGKINQCGTVHKPTNICTGDPAILLWDQNICKVDTTSGISFNQCISVTGQPTNKCIVGANGRDANICESTYDVARNANSCGSNSNLCQSSIDPAQSMAGNVCTTFLAAQGNVCSGVNANTCSWRVAGGAISNNCIEIVGGYSNKCMDGSQYYLGNTCNPVNTNTCSMSGMGGNRCYSVSGASGVLNNTE